MTPTKLFVREILKNLMILGIFGDIGTFGDFRTGIIIAKNRDIAEVFGKFGDNEPAISIIIPGSL